MEHRRVQNASLPKTLWSLTLLLCLGASACDEEIGWPASPSSSKEAPCEGASPGNHDPSIPGLGDAKLPGPQEPDASQTQAPDPTDPQSPESQGPKDPDPTQAEPKTSSPLPEQSSSGSKPAVPQDPMQVAIWEFLPDPKGSDGLADSPETVDLMVTGKQSQEGPVNFELSAQGWSPLTHESFPDTPKLRLRAGSLIRIERYKNQDQLDLAKAKYPNQVLDPKSGQVAVQILRLTGAGLRNKGGWLALRSGPEAALHGVIYGEVAKEKVDSQVLANWQGPFATKAPSGQALCKIPQRPQGSETDAAWWTACEPSSWGRPSQ